MNPKCEGTGMGRFVLIDGEDETNNVDEGEELMELYNTREKKEAQSLKCRWERRPSL
jgi:hypothetical protein